MDTQGERLCQQIDLLVASAMLIPFLHPTPPQKKVPGTCTSRAASSSAEPPLTARRLAQLPTPVLVFLEERRVLQRFSVTSERDKGGQFTWDQESASSFKGGRTTTQSSDQGFRGQKFFSSEHARVKQGQPFLPEFL